MAVYQSQLSVGDRVWIDGDESILATVTGLAFYPGHSSVQIGWVHCGDAKSCWIEPFRLTVSGAPPKKAAREEPLEDYPRLSSIKPAA